MSPLIQLLCDRYILLPKLPNSIRVSRYDPIDGIPKEAASFDALFVRTVSPVGEATLPAQRGRLRFIGSATAGIDHVDREWLQETGIAFAWSPGCNARAVGEYVATAVLLWSLDNAVDLSGLKAGIVGAGHTGQEAARLLSRLGISCLLFDPPRAERDSSFTGSPLQDLLECDILTFHTPLVRAGSWPTWHWLDAEKLAKRRFRLIINASRGGVVDEKALLAALKEKRTESAILDVWEDEPVFRDDIARHCRLTTPHIAGYSLEAKQRASSMILKSLFRFFGLPLPDPYPEAPLFFAGHSSPADPAASLPTRFQAEDLPSGLGGIIDELNPIKEYHRRFQTLVGRNPSEKSRGFQRLRSRYPLRHEHPFLRIDPLLAQHWPQLKALDFRVDP